MHCALRQPQGALTSARADADDSKSANRIDSTGAILQTVFRSLVFGVAVLNFLYPAWPVRARTFARSQNDLLGAKTHSAKIG